MNIHHRQNKHLSLESNIFLLHIVFQSTEDDISCCICHIIQQSSPCSSRDSLQSMQNHSSFSLLFSLLLLFSASFFFLLKCDVFSGILLGSGYLVSGKRVSAAVSSSRLVLHADQAPPLQ